jgi:hypothetical protein
MALPSGLVSETHEENSESSGEYFKGTKNVKWLLVSVTLAS